MAASGHILLRRPLTTPLANVATPDGASLGAMQPHDFAAVHALLRAAYANGFGSVPADVMDWWTAVSTDSEFDPTLALVARSGPEPVGFCLCWTSSFVKDLVVSPGCQGHGIGSVLLIEAMRRLKQRGHTSVALKVDVRNTGARRLYERMGFVPD